MGYYEIRANAYKMFDMALTHCRFLTYHVRISYISNYEYGALL